MAAPDSPHERVGHAVDHGLLSGLYRRLARNIAYVIGGTGATALFNMAALAFNVRALSPEDFGMLVLLQTAALGLSYLASFGTQQPVIRLGTDAIALENNRRLGQLIGLGLSLDLLAALLASAIAFMVIFLAGDWIGITAADRHLGIPFAGALVLSGYVTSNGVFRLLNRFGLLSMIQAGSAAVTVILSACFYWIGADLTAYIWMLAILMALGAQVQLWVSIYLIRKRDVRISFSYRAMARSDVREFFSYSWTTSGTSSIDTLRTYGDTLLVGALVTVEAAGIYNIAKQVAGILRKATTIYTSAVFPEIAGLAATESFEEARRLRLRLLLTIGGLSIVAVLGALVVGRPFLVFAFGPSVSAAYWAMVLLTVAAALQLVSQTLSMYVQVFIGPTKLLYIYLLSMCVYIAAAPIGILALSITGAALGQVLFYIAMVGISQAWLRRSTLAEARNADGDETSGSVEKGPV